MPYSQGSSIHRFQHLAMNTTFEIQIPEDRDEYARQVSVAVFQEIDRLEALLSRFDPRSDISQLNALQPGESVRVSFEVFECLTMASRFYAATDGAFDITFPATNPATPHISAMQWLVLGGDSQPESSLAPAGYFVAVHPAAKGEQFVGLNINLGGIGKGYALDRTREILQDWSIASALLHSGTSSVLAVGSPPGAPGWRVGVAGDWAHIAPFREIRLGDQALGSSGKEVQGDHIIDPRTGATAEAHLATWVRATTAAEADALSTAFMIMSPDGVHQYIAENQGIAALLVEPGDYLPIVKTVGAWDT
ncbi:MAG: FAD:protein FMN transferase [Candidatus Sumerlaeaceae bacterium]